MNDTSKMGAINKRIRQRFERFVTRKTNNECWPWKGSRTPQGHGRFWLNGRIDNAHRVAYVIKNGPIKNSLHVLHRCDNPWCMNPKHLYLGTNADNVRDRCLRGRNGSCYGERNLRCKLTSQQVVSIRKDKRSNVELSKVYGVGHQRIWKIRRGLAWRHIPLEAKRD